MSLHSHTVNIRVPQASILALLASAEAITLTPSAERSSAINGADEQSAVVPSPVILNPADLPRRFLDAQGNPVESGSGAHVITHFHTAGLMFDARSWQTAASREQARAVATQCDLLGRKGDWVIGEDYEMQLIADRRFHEPAVDKKSFPRAPESGLIYTNREKVGSSVYVWFVTLSLGGVGWYLDDREGLAVPVLRVPPSQ